MTLTSDRPEAFELCERWMSRQDHKAFDWIVIDDGQVSARTSMKQTHIRLPPIEDGKRSFIRNLRAGLSFAADSTHILFIEDDVYYESDYLSFMSNLFGFGEIIGQAHTKCYDINRGSYITCDNHEHSSLCQTGIAHAAIPIARELANSTNEVAFDIQLWSRCRRMRIPFALTAETTESVNVKCMPGKPGLIDHGHPYWPVDRSGRIFRDWFGDDGQFYERFRSHPSAAG